MDVDLGVVSRTGVSRVTRRVYVLVCLYSLTPLLSHLSYDGITDLLPHLPDLYSFPDPLSGTPLLVRPRRHPPTSVPVEGPHRPLSRGEGFGRQT